MAEASPRDQEESAADPVLALSVVCIVQPANNSGTERSQSLGIHRTWDRLEDEATVTLVLEAQED
jgi:hypothetical protein